MDLGPNRYPAPAPTSPTSAVPEDLTSVSLHVIDVSMLSKPTWKKKHYVKIHYVPVDKEKKPIKTQLLRPDEDGPIMKWTINTIIKLIGGTRVTIQVLVLRSLIDLPIAEPSLSLDDICYPFLQNPERDPIHLSLPKLNDHMPDLTITLQRDALNPILGQTTLSQGVWEQLMRTRTGLEAVLRASGHITSIHSEVGPVLQQLDAVIKIFRGQKVCYKRYFELSDKLGTLSPLLQRVPEVQIHQQVVSVLRRVAAQMELIFDIMDTSARLDLFGQITNFATPAKVKAVSAIIFQLNELFKDLDGVIQESLRENDRMYDNVIEWANSFPLPARQPVGEPALDPE